MGAITNRRAKPWRERSFYCTARLTVRGDRYGGVYPGYVQGVYTGITPLLPFLMARTDLLPRYCIVLRTVLHRFCSVLRRFSSFA